MYLKKLEWILRNTHGTIYDIVYATLLNDQGLNLKTISKILGHGNSEITDAVYIDHHEDKKSYDLSETMNMFYFENLCIQNSEVYNISNIRLILG